jgi:hypothetical protein
MAKVIVERPRRGSSARGKGKGYRRDLQRISRGELPRREGMKMSLRFEKSLNEHLGPLRRYLRKQVGRPWDKVFSEICENISRDSAVQDHVRDHVHDYVATNVFVIDGVLHYSTKWGRPLPVVPHWFRIPFFYVCPHSGLLKMVENVARRKARRVSPVPDLCRMIDYDTAFVRHQGHWSWMRFEAFPKTQSKWVGEPVVTMDALQKLLISRADAVKLYGRAVFATEARPASREEIRKYCEPLKAPNLV